MRFRHLALWALTLTPLAAQAGDAKVDFPTAQTALRTWLDSYAKGEIRMANMGQVDETALARARTIMTAVADHNTATAAQAVFAAATVTPEPPGSSSSSTAQIDFVSSLRVGSIRAIARKLLVGMTGPGVEEWLLKTARQKGGRDAQATLKIATALQILAARPGEKAKQAVLEGAHSLKPEVRVRTVNTLSQVASRELLPHFLGLVRDREPYVRIAAMNGIGRSLQEHTDETLHKTIPEDVVEERTKAIKVLREALLRDRIWQVRAAARDNLARLKTRHAIPVLIEGLLAELRKKKDPWALDIKLHRTLEGLTGQKIPMGQPKLWQQFWQKEGAAFAFAPAGMRPDELAEKNKDARYEKFFNLQLETNRVLFVVDFSGSMVEKITLKTQGVGTAAAGSSGRTTTKAKLVVEELKKIVMSLQDGDLFNIVVFGDDVRIWKARKDGRPALMKMNDELRDELLGGYLDGLQPAGMTNLHGALETALGFGGRGMFDKYYQLGFDTLYVLSDGAPTKGKVTDTEEILRIVRETNALKRLAIHTITFGDLNQLGFLKRLAEENGGRHVHVR